MKYENLRPAIFLARPNRFIAHCRLDGEEVIAHVKNTGRCRELLIPGTTVYLQYEDKATRKTAYTLSHVQKGRRIIQIDSQAPNRLVKEALEEGRLSLPGFGVPTLIRPETFYGESRFDLYLENGEKKAFVEIKGVTLEADDWARFPDAPTERGIKHLSHLAKAAAEGYFCYAVFVIQMEEIRGFSPNYATHPAFGKALIEAQKQGVVPLAFGCRVTLNEAVLADPVPVDLWKGYESV